MTKPPKGKKKQKKKSDAQYRYEQYLKSSQKDSLTKRAAQARAGMVDYSNWEKFEGNPFTSFSVKSLKGWKAKKKGKKKGLDMQTMLRNLFSNIAVGGKGQRGKVKAKRRKRRAIED